MKNYFLVTMFLLAGVQSIASVVDCGDVQAVYAQTDAGRDSNNSAFNFDLVGRNCGVGSWDSDDQVNFVITGKGLNLEYGENPMNISRMTFTCNDLDANDVYGTFSGTFVAAQFLGGYNYGYFTRDEDGAVCILKGGRFLAGAALQFGTNLKITVSK